MVGSTGKIKGWLDGYKKCMDRKEKQMDGWIKHIDGWLEGKQKYNKNRGMDRKNGWMVGQMDRKKQIDTKMEDWMDRKIWMVGWIKID